MFESILISAVVTGGIKLIMKVPSLLVVLALCFTSTNSANELDTMAELFGRSSSEEDERFFARHGITLFEQVATLNSMAVAKSGNNAEARLLAKKITLQVQKGKIL